MRAQLLLGLLREYPGYTLSSLLAESGELIRLRQIEALGQAEEV